MDGWPPIVQRLSADGRRRRWRFGSAGWIERIENSQSAPESWKASRGRDRFGDVAERWRQCTRRTVARLGTAVGTGGTAPRIVGNGATGIVRSAEDRMIESRKGRCGCDAENAKNDEQYLQDPRRVNPRATGARSPGRGALHLSLKLPASGGFSRCGSRLARPLPGHGVGSYGPGKKEKRQPRLPLPSVSTQLRHSTRSCST